MTEQNTGELQLADYGISGIPVFQISSLMSRAFQINDKIYTIFNGGVAYMDLDGKNYGEMMQ